MISTSVKSEVDLRCHQMRLHQRRGSLRELVRHEEEERERERGSLGELVRHEEEEEERERGSLRELVRLKEEDRERERLGKETEQVSES